jgi:hypothetical protein
MESGVLPGSVMVTEFREIHPARSAFLLGQNVISGSQDLFSFMRRIVQKTSLNDDFQGVYSRGIFLK